MSSSPVPIEERTAARLAEYYPFDQTVIDTVAEHAGVQASFDTYQDYLASYGSLLDNKGRLYSSLRVRPDDYDPTQSMVVNLPMANPLDPNQQFQVTTIAATNPDMQVVAFGNPSSWFTRPGMRTRAWHLPTVMLGEFEHTAAPKQKILEGHGVENVIEVGASYGADMAAGAAASGRYAIDQLIVVEPASVQHRSLLRLMLDFKASEKALQGYVEANGLPIFETARSESVSAPAYLAGLLRPANIAIALGIGMGRFKLLLQRGLQNHPDMDTSLVWGSDSELATDERVARIAKALPALRAMRLEGQKHALMNDVHLMAAIVLQARKDAAAASSTDS